MNRYGNLFGPIVVGDNCFIGLDAILLPGTEIGADSIVGAGSVAKGTFPPSSVIVGVPARRLYSLEEYIERPSRRWSRSRLKIGHSSGRICCFISLERKDRERRQR
jgi:carbonic anhydrase/acetyltransferase-like protein (isoleucine patch superfamily)